MLAQKTSTSPVRNEWLSTPVSGLSGAGSNQAGATVIPAGQDLSIFTTVTSSSGCVLPGSGVSVGEEYTIANHGANALSVYPYSTQVMGTASASAAYSLAAGKTGYFTRISNTGWTVNP